MYPHVDFRAGYDRPLTTEELFRNAYIWRFDKDIPHSALREDVQAYERDGVCPPYVSTYEAYLSQPAR